MFLFLETRLATKSVGSWQYSGSWLVEEGGGNGMSGWLLQLMLGRKYGLFILRWLGTRRFVSVFVHGGLCMIQLVFDFLDQGVKCNIYFLELRECIKVNRGSRLYIFCFARVTTAYSKRGRDIRTFLKELDPVTCIKWCE